MGYEHVMFVSNKLLNLNLYSGLQTHAMLNEQTKDNWIVTLNEQTKDNWIVPLIEQTKK